MNNKTTYIHLPILILLVEWVIVFYMHINNPYHLIVMSRDTMIIIIVGLFFITLGYYFMNSFYLKNEKLLPGDITPMEINEEFWGKFIIVLSLIIMIGLILVLREIYKITNGFRMYFDNPLIVRETIINITDIHTANISQSGYRFGSYLCSLMYPLSSLGGIIMTQKSKWRYTGLIPLVLVIFYSLVNLNRFGLITSIVIWLFSMIYSSIFLDASRRKTVIKEIFIYFVMATFFILIFFSIIIRWRAFYIVDVTDIIKKSFYSYITGSGSAFDKYLVHEQPLLYGASSFRSIFKWISRLGLISKEIVLETSGAFVNISHGNPMYSNTYTFAKALYEDFRILGVGLISLIWGMVARYLIEKCFKEFRVVNIFLVSIMVLSFIMTFYEFYFEGVSAVIYWVIVILIMEGYLKERTLHEWKP